MLSADFFAVCKSAWSKYSFKGRAPFSPRLSCLSSTHTFLCVLQAWADAFRSIPDLTGVVQVYEELKRKGIEFPTSEMETLSPIHTPQRVRPTTQNNKNMSQRGV